MSQLEHYDDELYAIEERIERLAIACKIDLGDRAQLSALTTGVHARITASDTDTVYLLRELLLLRDYVTLNCVGERGIEECRSIVKQIDLRLRQHHLRK